MHVFFVFLVFVPHTASLVQNTQNQETICMSKTVARYNDRMVHCLRDLPSREGYAGLDDRSGRTYAESRICMSK